MPELEDRKEERLAFAQVLGRLLGRVARWEERRSWDDRMVRDMVDMWEAVRTGMTEAEGPGGEDLRQLGIGERDHEGCDRRLAALWRHGVERGLERMLGEARKQAVERYKRARNLRVELERKRRRLASSGAPTAEERGAWEIPAGLVGHGPTRLETRWWQTEEGARAAIVAMVLAWRRAGVGMKQETLQVACDFLTQWGREGHRSDDFRGVWQWWNQAAAEEKGEEVRTGWMIRKLKTALALGRSAGLDMEEETMRGADARLKVAWAKMLKRRTEHHARAEERERGWIEEFQRRDRWGPADRRWERSATGVSKEFFAEMVKSAEAHGTEAALQAVRVLEEEGKMSTRVAAAVRAGFAHLGLVTAMHLGSPGSGSGDAL